MCFLCLFVANSLLFVSDLGNLCNLWMNTWLPIGIFDSGVGGLTVYRALHEHLPNERFVYLGDTARVPYGTKSLSTVERYAVENAQFLAARGIKLLVVACNTASALALPAIRQALDIDVVGVIGPGARAAVAVERAGRARTQARIGVIATESTVQSGAYTQAIEKADPNASVWLYSLSDFKERDSRKRRHAGQTDRFRRGHGDRGQVVTKGKRFGWISWGNRCA